MAKGGVREGAGRRADGEAAMEKARISMPSEMWDFVEHLGDGNRSAGVRQIVQDRMAGLQSTAKTSRPAERDVTSDPADDFTLTDTHFHRKGRVVALPMSPQEFLDEYRRRELGGGRGMLGLWGRKVQPSYVEYLDTYFLRYRLADVQQELVKEAIGAGRVPK